MNKKVGRSASGAPVYSYDDKDLEFKAPVLVEEQEVRAIEEHYAKYLGEVHQVFHEIVSSTVHVDVHWVKPTADRPYHILATTGMSSMPMNAPEECAEWRYAELMVILPETWPMSQEALQDEQNYWPIRQLRTLARMPHEYKTWLSFGHSVANGALSLRYARNTRLCGALILPPVQFGEEFFQLKVAEDKVISFFCMIPLYKEEMSFKMKHGLDALLDRLDAPWGNRCGRY